jgi:hypothetical protein
MYNICIFVHKRFLLNIKKMLIPKFGDQLHNAEKQNEELQNVVIHNTPVQNVPCYKT